MESCDLFGIAWISLTRNDPFDSVSTILVENSAYRRHHDLLLRERKILPGHCIFRYLHFCIFMAASVLAIASALKSGPSSGPGIA
jgi:hypothetical protein